MAGVDAITLKSRIRADIAWQQIVRGKFQSSLQIREKDVADKLASSQKGRQEGGRLRVSACARSCSSCRAARPRE